MNLAVRVLSGSANFLSAQKVVFTRYTVLGLDH
jgi:hypothetical protein